MGACRLHIELRKRVYICCAKKRSKAGEYMCSDCWPFCSCMVQYTPATSPSTRLPLTHTPSLLAACLHLHARSWAHGPLQMSKGHLTQYLASGALVGSEDFLEELLSLPVSPAALGRELAQGDTQLAALLQKAWFRSGAHLMGEVGWGCRTRRGGEGGVHRSALTTTQLQGNKGLLLVRQVA